MARISELHYSNAYADASGVSEFLEIALDPSEDPNDFVVGFYEADGSLGIEVSLTDARVISSVDPETGELVYVLSADNLPILLTDPDGSSAGNYEAYALTDTASGTVIDFYDIGGGTTGIVAGGGAAAGAVSENIPVVVEPNATNTSIQFNQPNPDTLTYAAVGAGDTGIPCFAASTLIDAPDGPRPAHLFAPGDLVLTRDNGPMPVLWVGRQTVTATGRFAPVDIAAGALGATRRVRVSPQHRVLVSDWRAQLYFGQDEVLVPAKALVDGHHVTRTPLPRVTYVHLLLEGHQMLRSSNLWSESFDLAQSGAALWHPSLVAELRALFPDLAPPRPAMARPVVPVQIGAVLKAA